ncbi:variable surface lipoprotein [Arthrobacter globiformis]
MQRRITRALGAAAIFASIPLVAAGCRGKKEQPAATTAQGSH